MPALRQSRMRGLRGKQYGALPKLLFAALQDKLKKTAFIGQKNAAPATKLRAPRLYYIHNPH